MAERNIVRRVIRISPDDVDRVRQITGSYGWLDSRLRAYLRPEWTVSPDCLPSDYVTFDERVRDIKRATRWAAMAEKS